MKLFYKLIIGFLLFIFAETNAIKCNAFSGYPITYLTYEWVNGSTWKLKMVLIIRCSYTGSWGTNPFAICYSDTCNYKNELVTTVSLQPTFPDGRPSGSEIKGGICSNSITHCDSPTSNSALYSFREYYYEGLVTLPEACGFWKFKRVGQNNTNFRDTSITNLVDNYYMYAEANLNNLDTNYKNNSASTSNQFYKFLCSGQQNNYSLNYNDPDSDSIVLTHIKSQSSAFYCDTNFFVHIPFVSPFTLAEPFNTGNTFQFNPNNGGSVSFITPAPQLPLLTFKVDEYRNGVWVGSSLRDMMFNIVNCSSPPPVRTIDTLSFANIHANSSGEFIACTNNTINLCSRFTVADTNAQLSLQSNLASILPAANMQISGSNTDTMFACLQWTPGINDTGTYTFQVVVTDTACSFPGVLSPQTYSYTIHVQPSVNIVGNMPVCQGDTLYLFVEGNAQYNWTSSTGAFTCLTANCDSILTLPNVNSIFTVSSNLVSLSCPYQDTVAIKVYPNFMLQAQDSAICNNDFLLLNSNIIGGTSPFNYQWLPTTGIIGSNTLSSILVNPNLQTQWVVTVSDSANCFTHIDTATIIFDKDFQPLVSVNDTSICAGDTILFSISGANTASIFWSPNYHISSNSSNPMYAWPDSSIDYHAKITSSLSACIYDTTLSIHTAKLVADAGPDRIINSGETITLGGSGIQLNGATNLQWYPNENISSVFAIHPSVTPSQNTQYWLVVSNSDLSCSSIDTVNISIRCKNVFMPNAFSPNSEYPENRTFGIKHSLVSIRYFKIYNRQGNLVFSSNDANVSWDGSFGGQAAASDTYFWMLSGTCPDGYTIFQKGDVILIR